MVDLTVLYVFAGVALGFWMGRKSLAPPIPSAVQAAKEKLLADEVIQLAEAQKLADDPEPWERDPEYAGFVTFLPDEGMVLVEDFNAQGGPENRYYPQHEWDEMWFGGTPTTTR